MALFDWSDKYSVNVKEIDKQHQMLVETLNELHEAMLGRKSKELLSGIITGLVDYTAVHFSYEEKMLKENGYPYLMQHKTEHETFVKKVKDFQQKYQSGGLMLSMEIMRFLRDWLQGHILGTDMKYSSYLNEKGVS